MRFFMMLSLLMFEGNVSEAHRYVNLFIPKMHEVADDVGDRSLAFRVTRFIDDDPHLSELGRIFMDVHQQVDGCLDVFLVHATSSRGRRH